MSSPYRNSSWQTLVKRSTHLPVKLTLQRVAAWELEGKRLHARTAARDFQVIQRLATRRTSPKASNSTLRTRHGVSYTARQPDFRHAIPQ